MVFRVPTACAKLTWGAQQLCMLPAPRQQKCPGAGLRHAVSLLGSEFSLSELLEHQLLKFGLSDEAFEFAVLHAEFF